MKKMLAVTCMVLSMVTLTAQNRLLDQPMKIKNLSMKVSADCFTATTFLEFEFYNPNEQEIEGLYRFRLLPHQVITAFQLELNGRFRDGSIEEKWKARNAYNTIVGKRIDPALLSLEWDNNYRLNIYPVPPKGSRRITITIQQTLQEEKGRLWYRLALNKTDTAKQFQLSVRTTGCTYPSAEDGFIANQYFQSYEDGYSVNKTGFNVALWQPVSFSFPVNDKPAFCTQVKESKNFFALRIHHKIPPPAKIHPKKILVYWDVSGSSAQRNTGKEMNFLKQFIQKQGIQEVSVVAFAEKRMPARIFYPHENRDWINYLQSLTYDGATRLDQLDFSGASADIILLFSDGYVSWGSRQVKPSSKPLYVLSSAERKDSVFLKTLVGNSGGAFIDLGKQPVSCAVDMVSVVSNELLSIRSATGKTFFEKKSDGEELTIYGELPQDDTISFVYGNLSQVNKIEKLFLKKAGSCGSQGIDRLPMLQRFASIKLRYDWEEVLEYGLKEKIVTPHTAYIVLERTEDYIKYNITPPKELEEECARQGYITKSTKTWRQQLREKDEYEILKGVINVYNERLKQWDPSAAQVHLSRIDFDRASHSVSTTGNMMESQLSGRLLGLSVQQNLEEVVVVGYGSVRKRSVTGSITTITQNEISGNTIDQVLQGRVAGLQVTQSQGVLGAAPTITIRGMGSISNGQPMYILDGFPVEGNINELVSVSEIETISVLKDASAAAIYGSRASNGAIVITRKKYQAGYRYSEPRRYRLQDMEDEEYLQEIKEVSLAGKLQYYATIRTLYADDAGFYIDMAQHLFESGFRNEATTVISNAAEVSNGDVSVLLSIAYSFENWKEFDKAIEMYRQVLSVQPDNLQIYRDLAWALYQGGKRQEAVETFYNAIKQNFETSEYYHVYTKASMLSEMNSIIAAHRDSLDFSRIPSNLILPMPVDLRIVLAGNVGYLNDMEIREPGSKICSPQIPVSKNGGYLDRSWSYYGNSGAYNIKKAVEGRYRISIRYYDYYRNNKPQMVRIIYIKNYGRKEQRLSIQNVIMNNQNGMVEIGEVEW